MKKLTAEIINPAGLVCDVFTVYAKNKTEGRKMLRQAYREETPSPSAGFYSFEECRVKWIENEETDW